MFFQQTNPFSTLLVETEVASRAGPPFVILGETKTTVFKYSFNVYLPYAVLDEWEFRNDIRLSRNHAVRFRIFG